jgi:hypothetical protein
MARKQRISAILCGVALLLSAGLGNATDIDAKSFRCIRKMTPVRQFYVDNLRGNLDATLAAANSTTGAVSTGIRHSIDSGRGHGSARTKIGCLLTFRFHATGKET